MIEELQYIKNTNFRALADEMYAAVKSFQGKGYVVDPMTVTGVCIATGIVEYIVIVTGRKVV